MGCLITAESCTLISDKQVEKPVARVHELYLYPDDIREKIPGGVRGEDSIRIARRIIEEWVKDKLLLKKAEQYLAGTDYSIDRQLEDYRASLLTFKYKQEVLIQRLDTLISDYEIRTYYDENPSNYLLNSDVVRLTYVKLPLTAPQLSMLRNLYRSEKDEDMARLEQYCRVYADDFIIKGTVWYRFTDFMKQIPMNIDNPGRFLIYNKNIALSDSTHHYLIHIVEHIPEKKTAPLEMVAEDIRSVLINKRKLTLLQELESSVYKEGLSRNLAEIYK